MEQFTRKAIMVSFMNLLEKKPLDKITVKDITDSCGINRGTFYYHYTDIFALIQDVMDTEAQAIVKEDTDFKSWQEGFLKATQLAKESRRQLYHAFNSISRSKLEDYLYDMSGSMMRRFVETQAVGLDVSEEDKEFVARFYVSALVGLTLKWIDNDMKEDPEQYINKMGTLFDGNIRQALEKSDARHLNKSE